MRESDVILCGHGSGTPRTIRADKYNGQRYSQKVTKDGITWRKGLVAVMRPKALTDDLRRAYKAKYTTILGRNLYSQAKRKYCYIKYEDGKYYSDCSSSQMLTLAAIGMDMPSYNTVEIFESSRFEKVLITIENGHIKNPELLKIGDQLLYAGADPTRTLRIGHVEGVYGFASASETSVELYQKFLNDNYKDLVITLFGEILLVDGEYGYKTRAASVAVWKHMVNKYYGGNLTPTNPNFFGASERAAADILNSEVAKHPTLGYILNGVLSGRGYAAVCSGTFTNETRDGVLKLQADAGIPQTGRLSAATWYALFN